MSLVLSFLSSSVKFCKILILFYLQIGYAADNYMFRVNNRNKWNIFKVNNKEIRSTSLTLTSCSSVSIVNFEQVNGDWVFAYIPLIR